MSQKFVNDVLAEAAAKNKKEALKAVAMFALAHVVVPIVVITAAGVIARKINSEDK